MTIPELSALLGGGTSENPEEVRRESAFEKFDIVCRERDLTPEQLCGTDDRTLTKWMREQMPESTKNQPVDTTMLRLLLSEYRAEMA